MAAAPYLPDLARSGLTAADARLMGVQALSEGAVRQLTKRYAAPAYRLPYRDVRGQPLPYYRLRFLEPVEDLKEGKELRYWQPPRTPPHAYLPPHAPWAEVLNSRQDIMITEGEKKAAAATKLLRVPTIGLGGVWSFTAKRLREPVTPDLAPFLKDRRVLLCFDSDPVPKAEVRAAEHALARAVQRAGGDAWVVRLPLLEEGKKTGLDDFLVARGAAAFEALEPERAGEDAELAQLNEEVCWIEARHAYYHLATGAMFAEPKRLTQGAYATRVVVRYDAKGEPVEKNAFAEWTRWPRRRAYQDLVYAPGEPKVTRGSLNVWPGWGVQPKRGSVAPFTELVDHLFRGAKPEHQRWFLQWLGYPLAHPGVKLYCAALLYSRAEGVGKSLIGESLRRVYGQNFISIKAEHLHSHFNDWAKHKQFILGDEVTGRDRKEDIDRLKNIVTQEVVTINAKYQASYELEDRANYLLTTNRADALMMAGEDRRFFVHEITVDPLPPEFYEEYDAWYRSEAGAAALFWYLAHQDLTDFNPRADAPRTRAKQEMARLAATPAEYDVGALLAAPDRYLLDTGTRDLYTAQELARILDPAGRLASVSVGRALVAHGLKSFAVGSKRGTVWVYPVRHRERWEAASHAERVAHYDGAEKA